LVIPLPNEFTIPPGLNFSDLRFTREPNCIAFNIDVFEKICQANGIDFVADRDGDSVDDSAIIFILSWYAVTQLMGDPKDLVAEDLMREMAAEEIYGASFSPQIGNS
jgi:hypothetical protein